MDFQRFSNGGSFPIRNIADFSLHVIPQGGYKILTNLVANQFRKFATHFLKYGGGVKGCLENLLKCIFFCGYGLLFNITLSKRVNVQSFYFLVCFQS